MAPGPDTLAAALRRIAQLELELKVLRSSIADAEADAVYIRGLLSEEIACAARVRSWSEVRPFGSTVARERLAEAQLPHEVTIDAVDVETLPRRVRLRLDKDGASLRATACLRTDDGVRVVYEVEDE